VRDLGSLLSAGSRLTAVAESQQAASRAHRREPPASRPPPQPTIAESDLSPLNDERQTMKRSV
jgi:hypothetical protein